MADKQTQVYKMAPKKDSEEVTFTKIPGIEWISIPYDDKENGLLSGKGSPPN